MATSGKPTSPNELSKLLDEALTNVSYHVRILAGLGCIELADTEPRRGALEHYYVRTELGKAAVDEHKATEKRVAKLLAAS